MSTSAEETLSEATAALTLEEKAEAASTTAAEASKNVNNSASSGAAVIDGHNSVAAAKEGEEEEESDEGDEAGAAERVLFTQDPSDLLTDEEKSALETIFKEMDTEKDGILRPKQMAEAMKRIGVDTDEDTLRRQLMMSEGDDEGIDLNDFIQIMAIHMKRMLTAADVQLAFSSFDLNNDGFIDKEELAHAMAHIGFHMEPEEIEEMIRDADKDGDGKISFEEFREKMTMCDGPGRRGMVQLVDGADEDAGAAEETTGAAAAAEAADDATAAE